MRVLQILAIWTAASIAFGLHVAPKIKNSEGGADEVAPQHKQTFSEIARAAD